MNILQSTVCIFICSKYFRRSLIFSFLLMIYTREARSVQRATDSNICRCQLEIPFNRIGCEYSPLAPRTRDDCLDFLGFKSRTNKNKRYKCRMEIIMMIQILGERSVCVRVFHLKKKNSLSLSRSLALSLSTLFPFIVCSLSGPTSAD